MEAKMAVHTVYTYGKKAGRHMIDFMKKRRLWLKYVTKRCIDFFFSYGAWGKYEVTWSLWSYAITASWPCTAWSVSGGQASSVCAGDQYSLPGDDAQKCFAPPGWPTCLQKKASEGPIRSYIYQQANKKTIVHDCSYVEFKYPFFIFFPQFLGV